MARWNLEKLVDIWFAKYNYHNLKIKVTHWVKTSK